MFFLARIKKEGTKSEQKSLKRSIYLLINKGRSPGEYRSGNGSEDEQKAWWAMEWEWPWHARPCRERRDEMREKQLLAVCRAAAAAGMD